MSFGKRMYEPGAAKLTSTMSPSPLRHHTQKPRMVSAITEDSSSKPTKNVVRTIERFFCSATTFVENRIYTFRHSPKFHVAFIIQQHPQA